MKPNTHKTLVYSAALAAVAALLTALAVVSVTGALPVSGQATPTPTREFEIGDVARFVVGGGAVHQGPIVGHRLTSEKRWVYDISFPATNGGEASVWEDLEEFRI